LNPPPRGSRGITQPETQKRKDFAMAKLGQTVIFTDRDTGSKSAAIVVQEASDAEGGSNTVLTVFGADASLRTVEAVPEGADLGEAAGTFADVQ
jgi:hypothetical protein